MVLNLFQKNEYLHIILGARSKNVHKCEENLKILNDLRKEELSDGENDSSILENSTIENGSFLEKTNEEGYACSACTTNRVFVSKKYYRAHLKQHHPILYLKPGFEKGVYFLENVTFFTEFYFWF